jgi:hypothetical protein
MAVVHVKEVQAREGSQQVSSRHRYTRTFQVLTDEPTTGARAVRDAAGLPALGDTWEQLDAAGAAVLDADPLAFLVEKRAAQADPDNLQNWTVTCEYAGIDDPTLEPAQVSFLEEDWQESVQRDADGELVANSAGDPYEAGLTRDRKRGVIVITKNVLAFDPLQADRFRNSLNLFPFLAERYPPGFGAETCKMDSLTAEAVWYEDYSDIHYYRRTARIATDPAGWRAEILDAGFHRLVGGERQKIVLPGGGTPTTPVPLDGAGAVLAAGGTPVFRSFGRYVATDWAELDLEF